MTIKLKPHIAQWARRQAAAKNTSVSHLVGEVLEEEMRRVDAYWAAYERWKQILPDTGGLSASERGCRDDWHKRSE